MSEATDAWFYNGSDGNPVGPHPFSELQAMAESGRLRPEDLVSNGAAWQPARDVPGLGFGSVATQLGYQARSEGATAVTPRTIDLFKQTSLWVRIVAIILAIGAGLMVLGGAAMVLMGLALGRRSSGEMIGMGLVYILFSVLYLIPCLLLFKYASRASAFANLRHERLLEEAVQAQKSFWKYSAIMMLVVIALYLLVLVGVLVAAVLIH